jgi:hypothetical protein
VRALELGKSASHSGFERLGFISEVPEAIQHLGGGVGAGRLSVQGTQPLRRVIKRPEGSNAGPEGKKASLTSGRHAGTSYGARATGTESGSGQSEKKMGNRTM